VDIIYKQGSILDAPEPYIIHGCNAQGRMGSGVAKALMDRYPAVKERYLDLYEYHKLGEEPFLGTLHKVLTGGPHTVFNAITQDRYGYDGALYASYDAIEQCMTALDHTMGEIEASTGELPHVAMPLLGCGLAGGDWSVVSQIIEKCSTHFQPVVYTLDGVVPGA
jgi:O-acetyl-ADP-ribose deacetylase (regulator of RNase III)